MGPKALVRVRVGVGVRVRGRGRVRVRVRDRVRDGADGLEDAREGEVVALLLVVVRLGAQHRDERPVDLVLVALDGEVALGRAQLEDVARVEVF